MTGLDGMKTADIILNFLIFGITAVLLVRFARKEGQWAPDRVRFAFRFFTCQSNALCAAAALLTAAAGLGGSIPRWIWILKYAGTAAVTVTMLTVFLFLWPSIGKGGLQRLLKGSDLFMHLVTPLLAIFTFCVPEKQGMGFACSLWGMAPVLIYGQHYLYRVMYAPEDKRWDDYYGFNKHGKIAVAFTAMIIGTFAVCMAFMLVQNA